MSVIMKLEIDPATGRPKKKFDPHGDIPRKKPSTVGPHGQPFPTGPIGPTGPKRDFMVPGQYGGSNLFRPVTEAGKQVADYGKLLVSDLESQREALGSAQDLSSQSLDSLRGARSSAASGFDNLGKPAAPSGVTTSPAGTAADKNAFLRDYLQKATDQKQKLLAQAGISDPNQIKQRINRLDSVRSQLSPQQLNELNELKWIDKTLANMGDVGAAAEKAWESQAGRSQTTTTKDAQAAQTAQTPATGSDPGDLQGKIKQAADESLGDVTSHIEKAMAQTEALRQEVLGDLRSDSSKEVERMVSGIEAEYSQQAQELTATHKGNKASLNAKLAQLRNSANEQKYTIAQNTASDFVKQRSELNAAFANMEASVSSTGIGAVGQVVGTGLTSESWGVQTAAKLAQDATQFTEQLQVTYQQLALAKETAKSSNLLAYDQLLTAQMDSTASWFSQYIPEAPVFGQLMMLYAQLQQAMGQGA